MWVGGVGGRGYSLTRFETLEMDVAGPWDISGMSGEHEGERGVSWDKMGWGPSGLI